MSKVPWKVEGKNPALSIPGPQAYPCGSFFFFFKVLHDSLLMKQGAYIWILQTMFIYNYRTFLTIVIFIKHRWFAWSVGSHGQVCPDPDPPVTLSQQKHSASLKREPETLARYLGEKKKQYPYDMVYSRYPDYRRWPKINLIYAPAVEFFCSWK